MSWLNWPNRITLARIVLIVPLVIVVLNANAWGAAARWTALALLAAMGVSDVVDGFLARRLNQESAAGKILDPLGDKLLVSTMMVLLAADATAVPGAMLPNWVPVIAIGKDVMVVLGFWLVRVATEQYHVCPRRLGKWCTVVQFVLIVVVLVSPDLPGALRSAVPALWWLASALAVAAVLDYGMSANRFVAEQHRREQESRA